MPVNKKKHGINIPGSILDSIRDNEKYEDDERFTKRQKIKGQSVLHRKENRKLQRQNKKLQKIEKKHKSNKNFKDFQKVFNRRDESPITRKAETVNCISPKENNDIHKIQPRIKHQNSTNINAEDKLHGWSKELQVESDDSEYLSGKSDSDSDSDSQDQQDEKDTSHLIQKIKELKEVQMSEHKKHKFTNVDDSFVFSSKHNPVIDKLVKLKGKRDASEIRIVKEDQLSDDSVSSFTDTADSSSISQEEENMELIEREANSDTEESIMQKLAALKGNKISKSIIKLVKEEELDDDSQSDLGDGSSDEDHDQKTTTITPIGNREHNLILKNVKESYQTDDHNSYFENSDQELEEDEQDVMKKLSALKGDRKSNSKIKIIKEDDLEDDSLSSDEELLDQSYESAPYGDAKSVGIVSPSIDEDLNYYAKKLKVDKGAQLRREGDDDVIGSLFDGLDFIEKYEDLEKSETMAEKKSKMKTEKSINECSFKDPAILKEEEEMAYYAKKLGIRPKDKLSKVDNNDVIGGLLEGIELSSDSEYKDHSEQNIFQEDFQNKNNVLDGTDDQINSDDFDDDDDLDEEDKALLREMYGIESDSVSESEYNSDSDDGPRVKENPYVAPGTNLEEKNEGSKYVPPALRNGRIDISNQEDSEQMKQILRTIKGPFNKLSEPTLSNVITELNSVYNDNPRQFVNEAIVKVLMQSISISTPMLESFLILYATAVVALYKLQGVEFGAFIVQKLVEKFNNEIESNERTNTGVLNLTGFIGFVYTLNLVGPALIYDIIKEKLITNPTELKTDILLKLIKSCGSKLRTDDTSALNEIVLLLTKSLKENETKGIKTTTRSRFLVDTITDLKNNRLKNMENQNSLSMIHRLKKQLGTINSGKNLDPIKVTLDDIENIEVRGKWWLIGSAWKGNETTPKITEINLLEQDDELNESNDVNWLELAKQCRMNTDVRRAIFISIMSAEDFMDAFMKLEKLSLKKSQKLEIPNILMHCATMENNYNPYYSFLAKKLCNEHSMRRAFQLNLWDFIKELDGEETTTTTILLDSIDDERLWKILNVARFFGFLIGEGALSLNVLRVINFLTITSDVELFLEVMTINLLDIIAKHSETLNVGGGNNKKVKNIQYTGKLMAERVAKCDEQPLLMKGLRYFINDKLKTSNFIKGKKQKFRVDWAIDTMSVMFDEMLKNKE